LYPHTQPGFAFIFIATNLKRDVPWRGRQLQIRSVKINRALMIIPLTQPQDQMLLLYLLRRRNRFYVARNKEWLRISVTEWLQHLVPAEKIEVKLGKEQLVIDAQAGLQTFI
jgi:hypothetical protein